MSSDIDRAHDQRLRDELDRKHPPGTPANAAGRLSVNVGIPPQHVSGSPYEPWMAIPARELRAMLNRPGRA